MDPHGRMGRPSDFFTLLQIVKNNRRLLRPGFVFRIANCDGPAIRRDRDGGADKFDLSAISSFTTGGLQLVTFNCLAS